MFRPRLVAPILAGVYTITAHAHGSAFFVRDAALLRPFLWGEFALLLLLAGGYLMNDLCDLTHDLVNRPEKVYLDRASSQKVARVGVAILFAGSLSAAAMVNPACLGVIACQIAAFVVYNLFSKRISWGKPVYVSLLLVSIYPLSFALAGGGVESPRRDSLFIFPIWLFWAALAYEIAADAADTRGDAAAGRRSYLAGIGQARAQRLAKLAAGISAPLAFIPFVAGMSGRVYLGAATAAILALLWGILVRRADFFLALNIYVVGIILGSVADIAVAA